MDDFQMSGRPYSNKLRRSIAENEKKKKKKKNRQAPNPEPSFELNALTIFQKQCFKSLIFKRDSCVHIYFFGSFHTLNIQKK